MTDHIKALREALAFLDERFGWSPGEAPAIDKLRETADALEAAMKTPVAWGMQNDDGRIYDCITPEEHDRHEGEYTVPLFAAPPAQQAQPSDDDTDSCPTCGEDGGTSCGMPNCGLLQAQAEAVPSPTAGMNMAQRILHVGGRNNAAGYVEFGSIQAVEALVRQVLRDLPKPSRIPDHELVTMYDECPSSDADMLAFAHEVMDAMLTAAPQPQQAEAVPVARVNNDGFIVETGLDLAPGMLLYAEPQQAQAEAVPHWTVAASASTTGRKRK